MVKGSENYSFKYPRLTLQPPPPTSLHHRPQWQLIPWLPSLCLNYCLDVVRQLDLWYSCQKSCILAKQCEDPYLEYNATIFYTLQYRCCRPPTLLARPRSNWACMGTPQAPGYWGLPGSCGYPGGVDTVKARLAEVLPLCWEKIPEMQFETLWKSMPDCVQEIIEAKGWQTRY